MKKTAYKAPANKKPAHNHAINLQDRLYQAFTLIHSKELNKANAIVSECYQAFPHDFQVLNLKAILSAQLQQYQEAEHCWLEALKIKKFDADLYSNLGNLYRTTQRYEQAEIALEKAIAINPNHINANMNLGVVYFYQKQYPKAMACYDKAIALQPTAQTYFNKGRLLQDLFDVQSALENYHHALALDPNHYGANSNLAMSQYFQAPLDATFASNQAKQIGRTISQAIPKFRQWPNTKDPLRPLKIGIVSGDLCDHPVGKFLMPVLQQLDKSQCAITAYSNCSEPDLFTDIIRSHCQNWHNTAHLSDAELAELIHQDGVDILVDLAGYTSHNRMQCFAHKPAPVQCTWLGYFATTGLPEMDYIVADPVCLPEHEEHLYSEKAIRLPYSRLLLFKPTDSVSSPLPCLQGQSFTFGCFQKAEKINAEVLQCWAKILVQAPNVRLRIQCHLLDTTSVKEKFLPYFIAYGIDPRRIIFVPKMSFADYQKAYSEVDIVLDTFPYTGGTTTVEALWAGVPTLTWAAPGMLGRQGEQLMKAANLAEWVCDSLDDYVKWAVYYAEAEETALQQLAQLRAGLPAHLSQCPAANPELFAGHLLVAFRSMWQGYCAVT